MRFFEYNLATSLGPLPLEGERPERPLTVACLNPHSFVVAQSDEAFHQALLGSDLLLPDGEGVCLALRRWRGERLDKIAGSDLHERVLAELEARGGSIYYMGSSPEVLARIEARLARECPHIRVRTLSPPYKPELSDQESAAICDDIRAFAPDALMVGMTAPKQEKWIAANRHRLQGVRLVGAVGGVFDFYAGTVRRAPRWAIRLRMEWLWRFLREPRRMWQRNMVSAPRFLRHCRRHRDQM